MDVYEHDRLSTITLRHTLKYDRYIKLLFCFVLSFEFSFFSFFFLGGFVVVASLVVT